MDLFVGEGCPAAKRSRSVEVGGHTHDVRRMAVLATCSLPPRQRTGYKRRSGLTTEFIL